MEDASEITDVKAPPIPLDVAEGSIFRKLKIDVPARCPPNPAKARVTVRRSAIVDFIVIFFIIKTLKRVPT
jgi:hypothetical protein